MSFFGKNIKKIRVIKGLSQQVFAELFSLKRATLGAYEEGRSEPKIDTLIKVANYFSISIDDFLTKEITVNQLLRFNEGITTDINQIVKASFKEIPFVNSLNSAFFVDNFKRSQSYNSLPTIRVPVEGDLDFLAFMVKDLFRVSDEEGLFPNDVVIGESKNIDALFAGDVVIALVDDALLIRRFTISDKGDTALTGQSPSLDIPIAAATYFWKVSFVFLKRYPKFTSELAIKINELDTKLTQLLLK
ncbi:putative prophage LambdaCh01, repressor protein [Polaribacter irgensii 23-P]|uniref:Putative prophage LambdaCh01, repressor protein n=1 Tax=Polaribacter irgensii 23-P TaxID=313594 RepID=A4BZG4_9FLAO|nr:helix-turn-helix transcriptional regulator [Polaribacter irgensii]EAR12557.1 putative prophage LambdaCh01, repressor protein [Polaribacter irgensii 23-P]